MAAASSSPADPAGLQFERAELSPAAAAASPLACSACGTPLAGSYFDINGKATCERCRHEVERLWQTGPGGAGFLRALGGGLAGAAGGALVYFVVLNVTGYQVGLIGILVGYLVGRGVHWGVRGRGGWPYQALAVLLTYLAIVSTYVPMILKGVGAESAARLGSLLYVVAAKVALIAPFLGVANGHVLGLVIVGISLYEAWKLNRRRILAIGGPYPLAARPGPVPIAEIPPAPVAPA